MPTAKCRHRRRQRGNHARISTVLRRDPNGAILSPSLARTMPDSPAARQRRYRANHPEKIRAANKARREDGSLQACKDARDPNLDREHKQERHFRFHASFRAILEIARTTVTKGQLDKPPLYFIDANGRIFLEDTRSAEQLIREYHKGEHHQCVNAHQRGHHARKKPASASTPKRPGNSSTSSAPETNPSPAANATENSGG